MEPKIKPKKQKENMIGKKQLEWQNKMKEQGLCVVCGQKAINKQHCEKHRKYHAEYQKEYLKKKKEKLEKEAIS